MTRDRLSRNDPCRCGSGRKYKNCCLRVLRQGGVARPMRIGFDAPDLGRTPPPRDPIPTEAVVRVGIDYTFAEAFGVAEVSYSFESGRHVLLTDGRIQTVDELIPGMRFVLQDGGIGTVTAVSPPEVWEPPPPHPDQYGNYTRRVLGRIKHTGNVCIDVCIGDGQLVSTTPDHPIWSLTRQTWVPAETLREGEMLMDQRGNPIPVRKVGPPRVGLVELYNLEIEQLHTFFVGSGERAALVHNGLTVGGYINKPVDPTNPTGEWIAKDTLLGRTAEAHRLWKLFSGVELPEITGIDFASMTHAQISKSLPAFSRGSHSVKAILIDRDTGRAFGIASGADLGDVQGSRGMSFGSGRVSASVGNEAGLGWRHLHTHAEAVAAAYMRKADIKNAYLYINAANPCWGSAPLYGCHGNMRTLLAEGSHLRIFNKDGLNATRSRPAELFDYTGLPDEPRRVIREEIGPDKTNLGMMTRGDS